MLLSNATLISQRLTKDDENTLPFKGRDKGGDGVFSCEKGVTLIELLIVLLILSIIVGGLTEMLAGGLKSSRENRTRTGLIEDANYAMNRIINATRETDWVFIPGNATPVRDILAIGAMADNDNDGVVDEDWGADIGNDGQPGIAGFDDDGDGPIDEGGIGRKDDNDEDGQVAEDIPKDGVDNDLDGNYDEEFRADINGDGCPGLCLRDDDGDGSVDEGSINDDDEDGLVDEDPIDPLIFHIINGALYEKKIIWDSATNANDITEKKVIDNVTQFRVERLLGVNGKTLIKVTIEVSSGRGNSVTLESEIYPRMLPTVTP